MRAKRTQTTTAIDTRVEGKIFLPRDEKTSPEEHESAAILFELMSGASRVFSQEGQKQETKKRKKSGNATNNTMKNKNANKMKKTSMTPMVTNTMKTTKRRLSAKFADVEETQDTPPEKEKRKKREPKKEETTNASMMKREKQGQLQQRNILLNDFVCKQLEADASVPKSWVAFAQRGPRQSAA